MTNDEAILWCVDKHPIVSWVAQGVRVQLNIPASNNLPRGSRILLVRADYATAVTEAKRLYDGVMNNTIPMADPSLVSTQLP